MLNTYLAAAVTKVINTYLDLDTVAKQRLAALVGKTITIHMIPWQQPWQLHINQDKLELLATEQYPANLTITGTALNFFGSVLDAKNSAGQQPWLLSELSLTGDIKLGQQFLAIIATLNVDWEAYLASKCGATLAGYLQRWIQQLRCYFKYIQQRLGQNFSEYLQEESTWLAPATLVADFLQDVDEVVLQVDRLAARLEQRT